MKAFKNKGPDSSLKLLRGKHKKLLVRERCSSKIKCHFYPSFEVTNFHTNSVFNDTNSLIASLPFETLLN